MKGKKSNLMIYKLCGLSFSILTLNNNTICAQEIVSNGSRIERSLRDMYEEDDLGACCLFAGDYINFGYWKGLSKDQCLNEENRTESSKALYRLVGESIGINLEDQVLEIGCGKGVGTRFILEEFKPLAIKGMDFSNAQITRAIKRNINSVENGKLSFICGCAEKIPFQSTTFDKIFSIEAAQHFESLDDFFADAFRVLKPNGKLGIASFFATRDNSFEFVSPMIQTVKDGIDKMYSVLQIQKTMEKLGYQNIKIQSIGPYVWPSFDKWVGQTELKNSWTRNWYKAFEQGLLDYYVITAEKPSKYF